jgi:hypothetical protein
MDPGHESDDTGRDMEETAAALVLPQTKRRLELEKRPPSKKLSTTRNIKPKTPRAIG